MGLNTRNGGVQALEALAGREPEEVTLLHVVDPSALQSGKGANAAAEKRALAAMEKAGGILLREAERTAPSGQRLGEPPETCPLLRIDRARYEWLTPTSHHSTT